VRDVHLLQRQDFDSRHLDMIGERIGALRVFASVRKVFNIPTTDLQETHLFLPFDMSLLLRDKINMKFL
jgi:hypothetical protein